ncbi:MAG: hypothetical protein M3Y65_15480 [Pseudomonadota bacterium]|nr:hypothetical protein [Pseudomonadota bacterium]
MPDSKQLLKLSWLLLAMCFSMSAVAAQTVFVTDLSVIPLGAVALAVLIAAVGGLASTLAKISSPRIQVENLWLVVMSDMAYSIVGGLIAFFIAAAADRPPFQAASAILIAGLTGAIGLKKYFPVGTSEVGTRAGEPGAIDPSA